MEKRKNRDFFFPYAISPVFMNYSLYFHIPFCRHRCAYCDFNTYAGQEALIPTYVEALCREIEFIGAHFPSLSKRETGGEGQLSSPSRRGTGGEGQLPSPSRRGAGGEGQLPSPSRRGAGGEVHTFFFGGGTPSLLPPGQFEKIFRTLRASFLLPSLETLEISLEANPGAVTLDSLRRLRRIGFNRISFGLQSAHPDELRQLERIHNFFEAIQSVKWARRAGFDNLNLDLIYGLPEQSLSRWQESLRRAVELGPQHLSLYALTVEPGTPFGRWAARGLLPIPDPDLAADMYEWAGEYLAGQGYEQYEISNWARPGFQCKHNLQYWRNQPYLGFGAGAHGYANELRVANVLRIKTYLERFQPEPMIPGHLSPDYPIPDTFIPDIPFPLSPATVSRTRITPRAEMQETMFTGLRLTQEGVSAAAFRARFGVELMDVFEKEVNELVGLGLLEWKGLEEPCEGFKPSQGSLRLTQRGRLLGNQVFMRFVE